jgi:hypothetical protein
MILSEEPINILGRDATELVEPDDKIGGQEHGADSDSDFFLNEDQQ